MSIVTIGCDPEFLLRENGILRASQRRCPGTKKRPHALSVGMVHRDNVAVEIGVNPASTADELVFNIRKTMEEVRELIGLQYELCIESSALFPEEELNSSEAMRFGCEGDFDAWCIEQNFTPSAHAAQGLRSAGGHVHIGYPSPTTEENLIVGRAADIFIGLRSVQYDKDVLRRKLYGRASSIRHKPYGVEYRSPSNWWLATDEYIRLIFQWATESFEQRSIVKNISYDTAVDIKRIINEGDEPAAFEMMDKLGVSYA